MFKNKNAAHEYYTNSLDEVINFIWARKMTNSSVINVCLRFRRDQCPKSLVRELRKDAFDVGIEMRPYSRDK